MASAAIVVAFGGLRVVLGIDDFLSAKHASDSAPPSAEAKAQSDVQGYCFKGYRVCGRRCCWDVPCTEDQIAQGFGPYGCDFPSIPQLEEAPPDKAGDPVFDPASSLVSYRDIGSCGPRGDDARADTDACKFGSHVAKHVPDQDSKVVASIGGCEYYEYTIHECNPAPTNLVFDPASPLVSYQDTGMCGPRGHDARADLSSCKFGSKMVKSVPNDNQKVVATIDGCAYFAYTVYACNPLPVQPLFDPASPLVTYQGIGSCGPRGNDAKADLRSCAAGAQVVEQMPNTASRDIATTNPCKYLSYTVYECKPVPAELPFDPSSKLVSYKDLGGCGPRGADARAEVDICRSGAHVVKHVQSNESKVVATIDACQYSEYTVYDCNGDCPYGYYACGDHCNWLASCSTSESCDDPGDVRGCNFPKLVSTSTVAASLSEAHGSSHVGFFIVVLGVVVAGGCVVMRRRAKKREKSVRTAADYWLG
mmetsp:Transcript_23362/g.65141  ORF Transcript_23362/g.65141 Transcript_23362/m.65141 type:complete len:478 (+) Transcript_23362:72-1505(+)